MTTSRRTFERLPERIKSLPWHAGFPVPWVSEWDSNVDDGRKVARETVLNLPGKRVHCHVSNELDIVGTGKPRLGQVSGAREVRSHVDGLCTVCGMVIGQRRYFIGGRTDPQCNTEGPVHRECGVFALTACPGLLEAQEHRRLVVTTIRREQCDYVSVNLITADAKQQRHRLPEGESVVIPVQFGIVVGLTVDVSGGFVLDAADWLRSNC